MKKTVAAAIATAIDLYLQAEQQSAILPAMDAPKAQELPRPIYSPWAMAGRQAAMETRRMWQMRLVR